MDSGPANGAAAGSRLLYREPRDFRVSVHEFRRGKAAEWGDDLGANQIVLCLNLAGVGTIGGNGVPAVEFSERSFGFFFTGAGISGVRAENQTHAFLTVVWSRTALLDQIKGVQEELSDELRLWLAPQSKGKAGTAMARPMTDRIEALYNELRQPPVAEAAAPLWYQAKALELLSTLAFAAAPAQAEGNGKGQEMFCSRQNRVARERVERTVQILQENLSDPPDLESLGAQVGCSPFYLSRLFSKEMKATIPQYVRELRMQRAAELLRAGRHNVTEAAMEVGYNSLSHFSKAFWEKFGCCPGLYPQGAKLFNRAGKLK